MRIGVIGFGAWGSALSIILMQNGHELLIWDFDVENLMQIKSINQNSKYLPGIKIDGKFEISFTPEEIVETCEIVVIALRSSAFRAVVEKLPRKRERLFITVTKGIEYESGYTMSQIVEELHPQSTVGALSGPTLAMEIAKAIPTAAVAAAKDDRIASFIQELFHRPYFRIYRSNDILGVELGGALKNVIAIAAGISDGLGYGANSKAALVTRGIAEIRRLGTACGAKPETFSGLSGLGDLVVTCFSPLSRNRTMGERLGRGETVEEILRTTSHVIEGVPTTKAAYKLAQLKGVETPIINQVYAILFENKPVQEALNDLLQRNIKPED